MIPEILSLFAWINLLGVVLYPFLKRHSLPRSTALNPLIIAAIIAAAAAAAKAGVNALSGKAKGKEADRAAREAHKVSDAARGDRNAANQAMLRSLFGGRYAIPEDIFANINAPRAYTGADPTKGFGYQLAGSAFGAAGDLADSYMLSKYPGAPSSSSFTAPDTGENVGGLDLGLPDTGPSYPSAPVPASAPAAGAPGQAGVAGQQFSLAPDWDDSEER